MSSPVIEQLRRVENDTWARNRARRRAMEATSEKVAPNVTLASIMYKMYTALFWCSRRVMNTLFHDESTERKTMILALPAPKHPWVCVLAKSDGEEYDITDIVNAAVTPGQCVTPEWLSQLIDIPNANDVVWEYVDSTTFEVDKITSIGLVNELKPKAD